jgi:glycogen operon protein
MARRVGLFLNGEAIPSPDRHGQRIVDDSFLVLLNADPEPVEWQLPARWGSHWSVEIDTAEPSGTRHLDRRTVHLEGRSMLVLRREETG